MPYTQQLVERLNRTVYLGPEVCQQQVHLAASEQQVLTWGVCDGLHGAWAWLTQGR